ncbi:MAG TPA: hypothetical protein ENI23_18105 [bacterium]|nr:hypothetical protein [bacterium]
MKKILVLILIAVFLPINLVLAITSREITVLVKDNVGTGIPAITITLLGPSSYSSTATTSISDGSVIFDDIAADGEYTATVSLPSSSSWKLSDGEASSKSVLIDDQNTTDEITFNVIKKDSQTNPDEEPMEEEEKPKILETDLPGSFKKVGSTSTNLGSIPEDEVDSFKKLTLDDPGINKIVFLDPIDLSKETTANKFAVLETYVSIFEKGRIFVDSEGMPELDKRATITMRGLSLVSGAKPNIVEDGSETTNVSNIQYDGKDLTFDVAGFSSFAFRPTLVLDELEEEVSEPIYIISGEVDDLDAKVDIHLGEELVGEAIEVDRQGKFEFEYTLEQEQNEFRIVAFSDNGEVQDLTFEVTFIGGEEIIPEETKAVSFLLVLGIVAIIAVITWFVIRYLKKRKKLKNHPLSRAERLLDKDNPPMPASEREDLMENKIGSTAVSSLKQPKK